VWFLLLQFMKIQFHGWDGIISHGVCLHRKDSVSFYMPIVGATDGRLLNGMAIREYGERDSVYMLAIVHDPSTSSFVAKKHQ
jgi:hypothetical protein